VTVVDVAEILNYPLKPQEHQIARSGELEPGKYVAPVQKPAPHFQNGTVSVKVAKS
jgi:hypothetical protein